MANGKVYLHAVVDTFGSYAFGFLHVSKQPEGEAAAATGSRPPPNVAVLHNDVLPFYRKLGLPVKAVLTDNGREFCGTEKHPYELYLDLNDIEHRRTRVRSPKTNPRHDPRTGDGSCLDVERFNRTVLDEFFRIKMRETALTKPSKRSRLIWTHGWCITIPNARIWATETWAADPSKPSCLLFGKKIKNTRDDFKVNRAATLSEWRPLGAA